MVLGSFPAPAACLDFTEPQGVCLSVSSVCVWEEMARGMVGWAGGRVGWSGGLEVWLWMLLTYRVRGLPFLVSYMQVVLESTQYTSYSSSRYYTSAEGQR